MLNSAEQKFLILVFFNFYDQMKFHAKLSLSWKKFYNIGASSIVFSLYSITSMARTRMALLPWVIRTLFFSPYKILQIAQENKYLGIFSYFIMELYDMCTH